MYLVSLSNVKSVPSYVALASAVTALVPVPVSILLSVKDDAPVPPLATGSIPLTSHVRSTSLPTVVAIAVLILSSIAADVIICSSESTNSPAISMSLML